MTFPIDLKLTAAALVASVTLLAAAGCETDEPAGGTAGPQGSAEASDDAATGEVPVFSLAWSEYPSWSVFGVAEQRGLIDGSVGGLGELERKHNVDIELRGTDYDTCLVQYANGQLDAVCITNIDILPAALTIPSVAVLPTSTSNGADAVLVTEDITGVQDLKNVEAFGLEKSVSEYTFRRGLQVLGENPDEYTFSNLAPETAATAMQSGSQDTKAIVVWNPFVLQTLNTTPNVRRLFDSSSIPGEIIDMVVATQDATFREGGDRFVRAVAEAFYTVSADLAEGDPDREQTLADLGTLFGGLGAEEMSVVTRETEFYDTPAKGVRAMGEAMPASMDRVVQFAVQRELVAEEPSVGFGGGGAAMDGVDLQVEPSFLEEMAAETSAEPQGAE